MWLSVLNGPHSLASEEVTKTQLYRCSRSPEEEVIPYRYSNLPEKAEVLQRLSNPKPYVVAVYCCVEYWLWNKGVW